jgi:hypothetical protein
MGDTNNTSKFRLIWGVVMVIIYICMAFMVVFTNLFDISLNFRIIIGALLFMYGLFRGFRLWKQGV